MKRYSLADYILSIDAVETSIRNLFGTLSIGGDGSAIGSISLSTATDMWSTKGYATGAWVHNKSLDRHGTCTVSINQLSDTVIRLIKLCSIFYTGNYQGLTLAVSDSAGNRVATCTDCYIVKIPDQSWGTEAEDQSWQFTCGKISYT